MPNEARRVSLLVAKETCGTQHLSAGLFWLAHGRETGADSHPDAEEIYYVISGAGRLVMDGEEFRVSKGQTVYISVGVEHQSFNDGEEDLCYFYACSTAFGRASRRRKTGRGYSSLPGSGLPPAG